jgi:alanine racemase
VKAVVPTLRDAGCQDFFVAHWSEVPAVAAHVPATSISVLHGPLTDADATYAKALSLKPVINSLAQARRWLDAGGGPCDLMVDTGINRLGLPMAEIGDEAIHTARDRRAEVRTSPRPTRTCR